METGCAISKSVSSMMTTHILNKTTNEVIKIKDTFIELLTEKLTDEDKTNTRSFNIV